MSRADTRAAYGFLSPWIVGLLVFTAGPVVATLVLSLTNYDSLAGEGSWVGAENYRNAVSDPETRNALGNTAVYALMYVPLSVGIGLGLAMLLQRAARATSLFRTLFYLPVVTPPVATGALFLLLLNGSEGLVNKVLGALQLPTPFWTTDGPWIKARSRDHGLVERRLGDDHLVGVAHGGA